MPWFHRPLEHKRALTNLIATITGCALTLAMAFATPEPTQIPDLHARVTDLTQTLTAEQVDTLNRELAALQALKGAQLAVLMIPTLAASADIPLSSSEDIESYATRVFEQWKLGRKGVDDGVLLIVVKNDHEVRIEVGYGLEGAIPDATSARIIREYIAPRFRDGDYYGGIHDATGALTKLVDGEALPPPLDRTADTDDSPTDHALTMAELTLAGFLVGLVVALVLENLFKIFPTRVIPIWARRLTGLVLGPALLCAGVHFLTIDAGPVFQLKLLPGCLIMGVLGAYIAPQGAMNVWIGGQTVKQVLIGNESWGQALGDFVVAVIFFVIGALFSAATGTSGGSGGSFRGGGGSSGGGGASGRW
jgi:uncharacterized protein